MEIFEILVGLSSILACLVSLFAITKVIKIEKNINKSNQKIKGNKNNTSGRDTIIK